MPDAPHGQSVNASDVTWLLRDTGLYDAGLSIGQPAVVGFTVDQTSETSATVHYVGTAPDRTMARLERAALALEADGYTVARLISDSRYYLEVTRPEVNTLSHGKASQ